MQRRAAVLSDAIAVPADAAVGLTVPAGTAATQSGTVAGDVTLGAGATLSVPDQSILSVFGAITASDAPATGTVVIADGATLFAAGPVGAGVTLDFSGSGTLELASQSLGGFAGTIAGFGAGRVLDITSAAITATTLTLTPAPGGGTGLTLTLLDDGVAVGTLQLAEASGPALLAAVPDGVDGTLILAGPVMAPPTATALPGSSGNSFHWQGLGGGEWSDSAHWDLGSVPGAADTVRIAGPSDALLPVAGAGAAASLTTSGDVALAGNFALRSLVIAGNPLDALDVTARAAVTATRATLSGGTWLVAGAGASVDVSGGTALGNGILDVADGGSLSSAALLLAGATLMVDAAGSVAVGAGPVARGTLAVAAGATMSGYGVVRGAIQDDGVLVAQGGTLSSFGAITGTGQVLIDAGATLFAAQGVAASAGVAFAPPSGPPGSGGSGTLELFAPMAGFAATLAGMQPGDALDFAAGTVTQATWTPPGPADGGIGVLDLGTAGTVDIAVAAGVDATAVSFTVADDGTGGSRVAMVPCFVAGTRLVTPAGEVAVEAIRVGDHLLTGSGAWRPVRWVGRAHHDAAAVQADPQLRPVRIATGALGTVAGVPAPARPLYVSPQHALLLPTRQGDVLVPAVALVDGAKVTRCGAGAGVTYFHVELDSHDVVVAEGALTESYLAGSADSRLLFDGPIQMSQAASQRPCRTRLERGPAITELRRRLGLAALPRGPGPVKLRGNLERATMHDALLRIEGWAMDETAPHAPVQVEILHDGVRCGQAIANLWRPDLDRAGLAGGSCAFVAELPWRASDLAGRIDIRVRASPAP